MDNAAFDDGNSGNECARILRKMADRIEGENCSIGDVTPAIDFNGNKVGSAVVTE